MAKGSPVKSKKQASPPSHPKYEDMIRDAIIALKERKGSSRQAIKKYILNTYKLPDNTTTNNRLKLAITKGVDKGIFSFFNGPSGTLKLVKKEKKEPTKKEKKEVEKKEKPKKAEKKEVKPKAEKKTTTRKAPTRKPAATTKKAPAKRKASTSTKKTRASTSKKASEKRTGTRRKAASS